MKRFTLTAVAITALFVGGCQPPASDTSPEDSNDTTQLEEKTYLTSTQFCGECGHEKGGDACCAENGEACDCGFHKGSLLCCKDVEAGKDYCTACGQFAGSELCCAENVEICQCGLHKGAPLCCKLAGEETAAESTGS